MRANGGAFIEQPTELVDFGDIPSGINTPFWKVFNDFQAKMRTSVGWAHDASLLLLLLLLEIPERHISCPPLSNFFRKILSEEVSALFYVDHLCSLVLPDERVAMVALHAVQE